MASRYLAAAVPAAQVGLRVDRLAALVVAGARPHLEVQVAGGGVARVADASDRLPSGHALALADLGAALQVHVDRVLELTLAVDDDVVAGACVSVPELHPARLRGDDSLAAIGEQVLALVIPAGAESVAVGVLSEDRELAIARARRRFSTGPT